MDKYNNIETSLENNKVTYDLGGNKTSFKSNAVEFPELPDLDDMEPAITITKQDIKTLYKNRVFLSQDELKPALMYYYFDAKNQNMVVTEGHVLKISKPENEIKKDCFLSKKTIEILNILKPEHVTVKVNRKYVKIKVDNVTIIQRNNSCKYPEYMTVIPENYDQCNRFEIDKNDLLNAIDLIKSSSPKATKLVKITVNGCETMELNATDPENMLESSTNVSCSNAGDNFTVGYNWRYLQSIAKTSNNDNLEFWHGSPAQAALINDNTLLMPIRLTD
jgi:DNA polymerase III sliding clamp (beta) subunit (PCNA family)